MPDFGAPVAQNVQPPSLQNLSTLMGLKGQQLQQQTQQQNLDIGANTAQAAQQTMQERQRITQMMQTGKDDQGNNITGADGQPDLAKVLPALGRMAPLTGQQYAQSIVQTHNAKTQLDTAMLSLTGSQRAMVAGPLQSVAAGGDPAQVGPALDALGEQAPQLGPIIANAKKTLLPHLINAPPAQRAQMANQLVATLQGGQQVQTQPQAGSMDNGQTVQPGTIAPPVAGGAFTASGPATQKQLPPTTPVMRGNTPSYLGAPGAPPVQAAPGIGQEAGITGPIAANNAHYAQVQADAQPAAGRIAALQTIKEQIPAAFMGGGTAGDYLRNVSKVFGGNVDANTAQDVMAKNLAVLAAQGGNTDAARTLGEMATPSFHMTAEAAKATTDQLIGIEAKKQAASTYFQGTPTSDPLYGRKVAAWNLNADPRAFEYAAKSPEDQAAMKAAMVKAGTWRGLQQKMLQLHAMGVDPQ